MKWPLILKLSLFGLAMAIGTVFAIPSTVEPICWLAIFVVCAVLIARGAGGRNYVHGQMVGIVNSVWVTGAHLLFFDRYVANHQVEAQSIQNAPLPPKLMMLLVGPVIGVVSGMVLGLFASIAGRLTSRRRE